MREERLRVETGAAQSETKKAAPRGGGRRERRREGSLTWLSAAVRNKKWEIP